MVSQDGGVPIVSQAWDGNAADTVIFKQRAESLINEFKKVLRGFLWSQAK